MFDLNGKILHIYCWFLFILFGIGTCVCISVFYFINLYSFFCELLVFLPILKLRSYFMFTFTESVLCSRHFGYNKIVSTCEGEFNMNERWVLGLVRAKREASILTLKDLQRKKWFLYCLEKDWSSVMSWGCFLYLI